MGWTIGLNNSIFHLIIISQLMQNGQVYFYIGKSNYSSLEIAGILAYYGHLSIYSLGANLLMYCQSATNRIE